MKLHYVPLDQIVWNPWRDKNIFPLDAEHVAGLRASIKRHGFFTTPKGRRRNGKVELGCGHARFEAAKKAGEETIPIFIDDIDDDEMLALMTDENALQWGSNPGAIMNEVAAATRRVIEGLVTFDRDTTCPTQIRRAFENKTAMDQARGKLRGNAPHLAFGHNVLRAYLGEHRGERAIREAISALKQSGVYAEIVTDELSKHPEPVADKPAAKTTAIAKTERAAPTPRLLDERTAHIFENDYQFHTFRQAVTTPAGRKLIPVKEQLSLAKAIMDIKPEGGPRKHITAGQIQRRVQHEIQTALKQQRDIDKEERERYLAEQRDAAIDAQLLHANGALRGMISAIAKMIDLAEKYPDHPKLGGFSAKLDTLVAAIQQFSKKLK
jgi:ParB/Sulfiredoxin domain